MEKGWCMIGQQMGMEDLFSKALSTNKRKGKRKKVGNRNENGIYT
jgi:hypothetical protein